MAILAQNCKKNAGEKKNIFFGLWHSLLMDLGNDQQQPPTVEVGKLARGGPVAVAVAVGISDMWQVTDDRWHLTCDTWHVTPDT